MFQIGHIREETISVAVIIFIAITLIGYIVRNSSYKKGDPLRKYFMPALILRMLGAVFIGLVYDFYYGGGDTFWYDKVNNYILNHIIEGNISFGDLFSRDNPLIYFLQDYSLAISILSFPIYLITAGDYYSAVIILGAVSFFASWLLFKTFYEIIPSAHKYLALGILFDPNQVVWTSGLFKDTFSFISISFITYAVFLFASKKGILRKILWGGIAIIFAYFLKQIKSYILYSFIPFAFLWLSLRFKQKLSPILRKLIYPVFLASSIIVSYFIIANFSQGEKWGINSVLEFAVLHKTDLSKDYWYKGKSSDSRYEIGKLEPTVESFLQKAPIALSFTFFRPFIWEVRNPLMLMTSIESLIILIFTIYILYKVGIVRTIKLILENDDLKFTLGFALFFGFFVGLTSTNYGNLVRYKTPAMPFFFISLAIIYHYGYEIYQKQTDKKLLYYHL